MLGALALSIGGSHAAPIFTEGFEDGSGSSSPYRNTAPQAALTVGAGDAAEGARYLRATCPGQSPLEGVRIQAKGISDFRLYTATAQVRGHGRAWLCLLSANRWLYARGAVTLTDRWQELRLSKLTGKGESVLGVNVLTREAGSAQSDCAGQGWRHVPLGSTLGRRNRSIPHREVAVLTHGCVLGEELPAGSPGLGRDDAVERVASPHLVHGLDDDAVERQSADL